MITDHLELTEGDDAVLVMDDLHHVDDSALARSSLATFVEHKPDWLHLLLLSRRRPAIPVDRLRAAGQLADIGFDALRFSDPEDLEMLTGLCPDTGSRNSPVGCVVRGVGRCSPAGGSRRAVEETGSPVGDDERAGLPGSGRLVDNYLWHEVLGAERDELVELLVSTAVVDRMNYGLAEALTRRSDAGDLLVEAEERGLFVTSLDPEDGSRCTASCARCCSPSSNGARPGGCASSTHAQPGGSRAWATAWPPSRTGSTRTTGRGAPPARGDLDEPFDSGRVGTLDRIIERIPRRSLVPSRLVGAVRLVPPAHRPAGFLDALAAAEESVIEQGTPRRTGRYLPAARGGRLAPGDWQACVDLALAGLAGLGDAALADPIGRFGWSLVVRGWPWRALVRRGASSEGGRPGRHPTGRRLAHEAARAVGSHCPDTRSTACGSPPVAARAETPRWGSSASSSTSPRHRSARAR